MNSGDMENRSAVAGTGSGLLLMAAFRCLWATLAEKGIQWKGGYAIIVVFAVISLVFAA